MNVDKLNTIDQLKDFLDGTQPIAFGLASNKAERYQWVQQNIARFHYRDLNKADRGIVMRYLMKVSGYSRAQLKRLIKQYRDTGHLRPRQRTVAGFTRRYTDVDIRLLAAMDERHDTPSGPMIKKLCERACTVFAQPEYERLANISVAHLYNLRKSTPYTQGRQTFSKTKPRASHIAVRRKPQPDGQPGYIRIDSVHQGDLDRQKGVYHINATDEVTQFEVVITVERISERYLIPALETLLDTFPFVVINFHSDNGSEYINKRLAELLDSVS